MIDHFSQLLTVTALVEIYLGLYFMFSNKVIAFTLIKLKVDKGSIALLVLHFSQHHCKTPELQHNKTW